LKRLFISSERLSTCLYAPSSLLTLSSSVATVSLRMSYAALTIGELA
jgi:hypothetical protein